MYGLMPAMHARDRVRMDGERDVLMHAGIAPPNALRIRVETHVGDDALLPMHVPLLTPVLQSNRCHQLPLPAILQFPTPHVVTTGDHAGPNPFGHPRLDHEMTDFCGHPHEISRPHINPCGIDGIQPEGIGMRDLVQPFGVGAAGVDLHWQSKRRN